MLIKAINECQQTTNQSIITRVKHHLANKFSKLKTLAKDVFEREEQQYLIINGKKIKEKDLPNSVTGPSDLKGITWNRIEYYPEDIEKMKTMTDRECIEYKGKLIEQNKYRLSKKCGE